MKTRQAVRSCYAWLLHRAAPSLDRDDVEEACADFERLRTDARQVSIAAWLMLCAREVAALASTWWRERRRHAVFPDEPRGRRRAAAWASDGREALRGITRRPGVAMLIVVMLALGIGANGATFTLLDRLLLRGPVDVVQADRLV
ncbi:MAG TPA: hypothetical protein VG871_03760, partial [Vicinamibacterales bacterium]|nr:hypothetical protein [Vicinamibacterales bacterium]